MELYVHVSILLWNIAIHVCSIMAHYIYVFVPSWNITYVCGCVCVRARTRSIVIMQKRNWVFMNCYENKSCISTAAEF